MPDSESLRKQGDVPPHEMVPPKRPSYVEAEEKIYQEAERVFRFTDSLIVILLTAMSGGVIGFFLAGAVNLALVSLVSMVLGLAFGWLIWKRSPAD